MLNNFLVYNCFIFLVIYFIIFIFVLIDNIYFNCNLDFCHAMIYLMCAVL